VNVENRNRNSILAFGEINTGMLIKSILKASAERLLIVNLRYLFYKAEKLINTVAKQDLRSGKGK
jgi:hypothetical protein